MLDRQMPSGVDVLDIGCGTGTFPGMIALSNLDARHIVGLDYAMEMCQQAARKAQRFDSVRGPRMCDAKTGPVLRQLPERDPIDVHEGTQAAQHPVDVRVDLVGAEIDERGQ